MSDKASNVHLVGDEGQLNRLHEEPKPSKVPVNNTAPGPLPIDSDSRHLL